MTFVSAHEFRDAVRNAFKGLDLSDTEIIDRVEENRQKLADYTFFTFDLISLLGFEPSPEGITNQQILDKVRELVEFESAKTSRIHIIKSIHSTEVGTFAQLYDDVQQAFAFRDRVKNLLYEKTGGDVSTVPDDEAIKSIQYLQEIYDRTNDETIIESDLQSPDPTNTIHEQRELSGIASVLNMPLDSSQPDMCFEIMKLKEDSRLFKRVINKLVGN